MDKNFFRTIKFRLTLLNSLTVFIFCALFALVMNLYFTKQLRNEPVLPGVQIRIQSNTMPNRFRDLAREEQDRIKAIREQDLAQIREFSLVSLFPLGILSFMAGYFLTERMLSPLAKLNKKINALESKNLHQRIDYDDNGDEISELIQSFNNMTERLNKSFEAQMQFVEGASHEMKTPLAVIQTNLDTLVLDEEVSAAELKRGIKSALVGVENLNTLLEDMLVLAIETVPEKSKVNLNNLLKDQVELVKPLAQQHKLAVEFSAENAKAISINTNPFMLERVIQSLLENALKYSKSETEQPVKVTLKSDKRNATISVSNDGEEIPETEAKKIFARFYRIDKSRSRQAAKTKGVGGFGLGLSIAKSFSAQLGGSLELTSRGNPVEFTLELPLKN